MKKILLLLTFFFASITFAQTDLVITNTNNQEFYVPGTSAVYTVRVTNFGPVAATNVHVVSPVPSGITTFYWEGSNFSFGSNSNLDNTVATLGVGEVLVYTIHLEIPNGYSGPLTSTASVTMASPAEINTTSNQATDTDQIANADISVVNTDNTNVYHSGQNSVYTLTIKNNGPTDAVHVVVKNDIPEGLDESMMSWTGSNGTSGTGVILEDVIELLPVGESVVYTVTIAIPATFSAVVINKAVVYTTSTDPTPDDFNAFDTNVKAFGADLVVVNTDNQDYYTAGQPRVYTVTVSNEGPETATNVQVFMPAPNGTTITSWSGTNSSSGTNSLEDTIATLAPGATVTYTVTIAVPAGFNTDLVTQVTASSDQPDPNPCMGCTDTDKSGADISVSNTDNKTNYVSGTQQTYTVTVTNNGPNAAENVHVSNVLPSGVSIASWTGSNGTNGGGTFEDTIASLANGATVTYTITINIPVTFSGGLTHQVVVTSDTIDLTPGCPQCTDTDTQAGTDISVTSTDGGTTYNAGTVNVKTYTVTVTNNGPLDTNNVLVQFTVPAATTGLSWTANNGTSGNAALNASIATLANGASVIYTVTLQIPATFSANYTTTATVTTTATTDTASANNTATDTDTPVNTADVVMVNTDNQDVYTPGGQAFYTVTVTNNGPSTATGINVVFPLPAGITSMNWTSTSNSGSGAINTTIPTLAVGQTVTYSVTVDIPGAFTGNLVAQPSIASTTSVDPVTSCARCTDIDTNGTPQADVIITNTDNQGFYVLNSTRVYTMTVTNNGPQTAMQVHIENPLPSGIATMTWTANNSTSGNGAIDLIIPSLANGASIIYTVTVTVPANFSGSLINTATVSTTPVDSSLANNTATDTDVAASSDIVVTNSPSTPTPLYGTTEQFTVTVTNNGPQPAMAVAVANAIPAGVTVMSWSGSNGSSGTGTLANTIQYLGVGTSVTYTITIQVPASGSSVSSTATTTLSTDPNPANSTATAIMTMTPANNDIGISITDGFTTYIAGQSRVYTVTVTNNGATPVSNIQVGSIVPGAIATSGYTWSGNSASGSGAINNTINTLGAGQSVTYTITVSFPSGMPQNENLINTVTATVASDPRPTNNTATDVDVPGPSANLVVNKTDNSATYQQSGLTDDKDDDTTPAVLRKEYVTYTITIINYGPSDSVNIQVTDNIPVNTNVAGTQISPADVTWSGNGHSGTGNLHDTIAHLAVGGIMTYTVKVYIPMGFQVYATPQVDSNLINTVTVVPGTPDPVIANNTATDNDVPSNRFLFVSNNTAAYSSNGQESGLAQGFVENILVRSHCAQVSNFKMYSGASKPGKYGVAYFNRRNSDFPIQEGLVLSSGDATLVGGEHNMDGTIGNGTDEWTSDDIGDLTSSSLQPPAGITASLHTPQYLKFNFVPSAQELKFNYIFAAEEYHYGNFECFYADVFAFILKDLTAGTPPVNLAILPNTTTPVKVTTVHRATPDCTNPVNAIHFGKYNFDTNTPENTAIRQAAAISINGQTKLLTAKGAVIPGHEYSIQLIIANATDNNWNSAVFIEAGSFKFDAEVTGSGPSASIKDFTGGNSVCNGQTQRIQYGDSPLPNATYSWLKNGVRIDNATDYFYDVTQSGRYTAVVTFGTGCQKSDDIDVSFTAPLPTRDPFPVPICQQDPPFHFNIDQTNYILNGFNPANYPISYYENEQDAIDEGLNDIVSLYGSLDYVINTPMAEGETKTIYVRIADQGSASNCVLIKPLVLSKTFSKGEISYPAGPHCIGGGTVSVTQSTEFTPGGYYEASPSGLNINFLTGEIDLDTNTQSGSYTIKYKIPAGTCSAYESQPVTFDVSACLVTTIVPRGAICAGDTFVLETSAVNQPGVSYVWSDANGVFDTTTAPQTNSITAPLAGGSYTYSVVATMGTESSPASSLTLVVNPIPSATISGPNNVCTGDSAHIVITGVAGDTVKYTDGTTVTPVVITNTNTYEFDTPALTAPATYQLVDVVSSTVPPCSQTITAGSTGSFITISVGTPTADIIGPTTTTACEGESVTITILGTPGGVVNYNGGTAGGGSVNLDATSGQGTITQTLNGTTTYTLTSINVAACGQTQAITGESITINVFPLPDLNSFTATTTVCEGTDATLSFVGTANATVNFHDSSNTAFAYVIPASGSGQTNLPASTYTLDNITSTDSCVRVLSQSVTTGVDLKPVITTQPVDPPAICEQETFSMSVQATGTDLTYVWKHGTVTVQDSASNTYTKTNATLADGGIYTVTVHGKCAPDAISVDVEAIVNEGPHVVTDPVAPSSSCPGDDIILTVATTGTDASTTYVWKKFGVPVDGAPSSDTLELLGVTEANEGDYTCEVINSGCPSVTSNVATVTVDVTTAITQQPQAVYDQCTGDGFVLDVTAEGGDLVYEWSRGNVVVQSGSSSSYSVSNATINDAGTYHVTVSGTCGGLQTSTDVVVNISVAPQITEQPTSVPSLCAGQPLSLSVQTTGDVTLYQWKHYGVNVGTNSRFYTVSSTTVADSGDYICVVSNDTCDPVTSVVANVTIIDSPTIVQQPVSRTVCVDDTILLFVETTGNVTYKWTFNGADTGVTTPTLQIDDAALTDSGVYRCIISDATLSCPDIYSQPATITVRPLPNATIANGASTTICDNTGTDVIFRGTPNAVVTYTVNGGEEQTITLNPSGSARLLTGVLGETTTYSLVSVAANNNPPCPKALTGEAVVTVLEIPDPELDQDGYICLDPASGQTMTGSFYELNTGLTTADGYQFIWYLDDVEIPGATEGTYDAVAAGSYKVIITDTATGCTDSAMAPITTSTPPLTITAQVDTLFFADNASIVVTATPASTDYEYRLDDGPWQTDNVFSGVRTVLSQNTTGDHTVYVRDLKACDELSYDVKVVDYPKYFTPNGDGFHDTWNISVLSNQPNAKIYIFDRFGKLLKQISTTNPTGWDGTYNGQPMAADDYWFVVKYMEQGINKEFRAHFTLKR
ncbi:choice-of-anchor L domain-containing protein [Flavobacterium pallidum]|uniref:Ig-like domain-containing protein n=1 Tax=Flavobacterium pallidum TaxID=2172098 RepID=A0A2S1SED6_9FLAO|nr:choice-of-anchor L domain-containing protein [Flavobacterium pallidum]AWI24735.1 hypothetical protein HYN49_01870 [Flavobacterium pallidum]